ncbi:MAG: RnfH family protein [Methylococcaceae bacterium]|nr:RnfH family protein [Methylococcaceae bacterium]
MIKVEIAYAKPEKQVLISILVTENCTVGNAILESEILTQFSELNLDLLSLGIFSTPCTLEKKVEDGDRIEIYRPLQTDPKDARRQRALKK